MKLLLAFALVLIGLTLNAQTNPPGSVMLGWTNVPNSSYPLSAISGYNLWYGTTTNLTQFNFVTNPMTLGVQGTVINLTRGQTYYFAVKAIATNGLASDFSSMVSTNSPAPPTPPVSLTIITVQ